MNDGRVLIDRVNFIVDADFSSAQKLVLLVLARHDGPGGCFPSIATIARKAAVSTGTVKRTLRELVAMGLIERTARFEPGSREKTTSLYRLLTLHQVGSPGANVGSVEANLGSPRSKGLDHCDPKVGSQGSIEQPSLNAFIEQPIPAAVAAAPRKARSSKSKEPKPTPTGHAETVDVYFAEFERVRGTKPPFGAAEGKAISQLIERLNGAEGAQQCIRSAFADSWWAGTKRGTILDLARTDYGRFVGTQRAAARNSNSLPRQPGRWTGDSEEGAS